MKKIPVRQTIVAAYRFTFLGVDKVIALIWLPMILVTVGDYFATGTLLAGRAAALDAGDVSQLGPIWASQLAFSFIELVLFSVIAVAIMREILRPMDGRPSFLRFNLAGAEIRTVGGFVAVYLLMVLAALGCGIIGAILGGVVARSVAAGPAAIEWAVLVAILLLPVLVPAFIRLSYFIVPTALVEGKLGLEQSWKLSKGNVLRIIAISLAVIIPPALVAVMASALVLGPDGFNPHLDLIKDKAAFDHAALEQSRALARHLPLLKGIEFILAPFLCGLTFSAPAFVYKFLTQPDAVAPLRPDMEQP